MVFGGEVWGGVEGEEGWYGGVEEVGVEEVGVVV